MKTSNNNFYCFSLNRFRAIVYALNSMTNQHIKDFFNFQIPANQYGILFGIETNDNTTTIEHEKH